MTCDAGKWGRHGTRRRGLSSASRRPSADPALSCANASESDAIQFACMRPHRGPPIARHRCRAAVSPARTTLRPLARERCLFFAQVGQPCLRGDDTSVADRQLDHPSDPTHRELPAYRNGRESTSLVSIGNSSPVDDVAPPAGVQGLGSIYRPLALTPRADLRTSGLGAGAERHRRDRGEADDRSHPVVWTGQALRAATRVVDRSAQPRPTRGGESSGRWARGRGRRPSWPGPPPLVHSNVVAEAQLMPEAHVVTDDSHLVLGMVSEVALSHAGKGHRQAHRIGRGNRRSRWRTGRPCAQDLLDPAPVTVDMSADVRTAAPLPGHRRAARLPVVDPLGRLAGVVTRWDLMRADGRAGSGTRSIDSMPLPEVTSSAPMNCAPGQDDGPGRWFRAPDTPLGGTGEHY